MSRTTRILLLLVLMTPGISPGAAAENTGLDVLLERHAEALGGRLAIESIRTVVLTGEIEMPTTGMKGTMMSVNGSPCLSYSRVDLGLFTVTQGYDGSRIWMVGPNGMLQIREDEDSRRSQVTTCLLEDFGYLGGMEGFTLEYAGISSPGSGAPGSGSHGSGVPDSAAFHLVTLVPDGGYPCRLYIDRSTYLVAVMEVESMAGVVEQRFYDYRETSGIMIPYRTVTTQRTMGQTLESRILDAEINGEVDPAVFLPPGDLIEDFAFTSGGDSSSIRFRYVNRHIYVPVRLDGDDRERLFLLDSGAGMTLIDETVASGLGLESEGRLPGAGAGGMAEFGLTRIPGFTAGGITFDEQTVIIYPIASLLARHSGIETGGVLGYDFLSRFVTKIDYDRRMITFFRPGSEPAVTGADTVRAPLYHKLFSIRGVLDGKHEGTFIVDTGANSSILNKQFADSNRLLDGRRSAGIFIAGAGGQDRASVARFESFSAGAVEISGPVLSVPLGGRGIGAFEGISGIIGNDILERFTVWLDYGGQMVAFKAGRLYGEPFWPDRSGIQLAGREDGSLEAKIVITDSPADRAGIRNGDTIYSVGGIEAKEENIDSIILLLSGDEGDRVEIEFGAGGEKRGASIVLEPYI